MATTKGAPEADIVRRPVDKDKQPVQGCGRGCSCGCGCGGS